MAMNGLKWPFFAAASGVLFFAVGVSTVRETYREWKVDQEINQMKSEVDRLEGRKLGLVELLNRLDSPDAIDKEARTRLGLVKPGEKVVILRGLDGTAPTWQTPGEAVAQLPPPDTRSNPQRWVDYFFKKTN